MPQSGDSGQAYDCEDIQEAVDKSIEILGSAAKIAVIENLARRGISLSPPCSPIEEIEKVMVELFGDDAARILIADIHNQLNIANESND
jgi:hypothetical protein